MISVRTGVAERTSKRFEDDSVRCPTFPVRYSTSIPGFSEWDCVNPGSRIDGRMNVLSAVRLYLNGMIEQAGSGMKVLLMDRDTISFVSVAFAQSDMLAREVYLFERIDKTRSDGKFILTRWRNHLLSTAIRLYHCSGSLFND